MGHVTNGSATASIGTATTAGGPETTTAHDQHLGRSAIMGLGAGRG